MLLIHRFDLADSLRPNSGVYMRDRSHVHTFSRTSELCFICQAGSGQHGRTQTQAYLVHSEKSLVFLISTAINK